MVDWVCVSDLHAGGLTSLLNHPGIGGADAIPAFATALGAFLTDLGSDQPRKPQLILLGDVLDLQFSERPAAVQDGVRFLQALQDTGCFGADVLATAGNHDHAIWAEARLALEAQAVEKDIPDSVSFTPAFEPIKGADSRLLTAVVQKAGFRSVDLRYPNIGFSHEDRSVVYHHGHYVEGIYRLVSQIKDAVCGSGDTPMTVDRLTAENASWIDFAWSPFNGAKDLERLYQNFLTTAGYRKITKTWADRAAEAVSGSLPFPGNATQQSTIRTAMKFAMEATMGRARDTERMAEVTSLTHEGMAGLTWYLEQPVQAQIMHERPESIGDVTFVLGHTHRPFSLRVNAAGYAAPVRVYNTGGWTLNGPRLDNAEGAALVLMDDQLNVASLRLFSTPRNGEVPEARIEMLDNGRTGEAEFRARLEASLAATKPQWEALRNVVGRAYRDRQRQLLALTDPDRSATE